MNSKTWECEVDKTRWTVGVEWYKELGWVQINIPVFSLRIWWKERPWNPYIAQTESTAK